MIDLKSFEIVRGGFIYPIFNDFSVLFTEKSKHVEGLIHQYFEGLVKDIQTVDSVISYN
jgi:hypothetical protein